MHLPEVSIDSHRERAAVFVAEPTADCGNIDARFDTRCGEEVSEIVVLEMGIPEVPASGGEAFLGVVDEFNQVCRPRVV